MLPSWERVRDARLWNETKLQGLGLLVKLYELWDRPLDAERYAAQGADYRE
jgi:hypothetical protein